MKSVDIDITCPNCSKKAAFYATKKTYFHHIRIGGEGTVICSSCGLNRAIEFSPQLYFYQIPIKNRVLFARTFKDLIKIRDHFRNNQKTGGDPDLDFPKVFYENRLELVKLIESRINSTNS